MRTESDLLRRTVLHADETPIPMLKPGLGHTHRAYLWSYGTTEYDPAPIVVYDFAEGRSGRHARTFLGDWTGTLVCDDYVGYKALFKKGVIEAGCMAHARRKFHELYTNHRSQLAVEALELFGKLYKVEREAPEQNLDAIGRARLREERARPIADLLHEWLVIHRLKVPDGSASAKAIDYSLKRWKALIRYIDDGNLPIDTDGKPHPPGGARSLELAVRRLSACRQASRRHHEPDPVGQAQRARPVPLSGRRPGAPADAAGKPAR